MQQNPDDSKRPVRLDLNTKVSIMASIMYGLTELTVDEAVEKAIALEQRVTARVRQLKAQNHLPPSERG